jgi:hypothetical protein
MPVEHGEILRPVITDERDAAWPLPREPAQPIRNRIGFSNHTKTQT